MRAIRARYNPYLQSKHRLEQVLYAYLLISLSTVYLLLFSLCIV